MTGVEDFYRVFFFGIITLSLRFSFCVSVAKFLKKIKKAYTDVSH